MWSNGVKIWLIQPSEQLPIDAGIRKLRTRLLAETLASRGHEVTWWASCFNHLRKQWYFPRDTTLKPIPGVTIHALHGIGYRRNVSLARIIDHRLLTRKFTKRARREPIPDFILTSLPPYDLAAAAVVYANKHKVPIAVDIRDKWPDNFVDVLPKPLKPFGRVLLNREFALRTKALVGAQAILSMTTPLLEWGLGCAERKGSADDRVFYLGSYREPSTDISLELNQLINDRLRNKFVVTFVGTFSTYHNPEIVLEVARRLRDQTNIVFVLVGEGDLASTLRARAIDLSNVIFTGWLNSAEMTTVLKHSHLGLCTSGKTSERNFLPNKVFSYLSEGVPIASIFDGELRELIERYKFGFNFSDAEDLFKGICEAHARPDIQVQMSRNASSFYESHCVSDMIYSNFADHIERLSCGGISGISTILENHKA